jgi:hypothetical protein
MGIGKKNVNTSMRTLSYETIVSTVIALRSELIRS